MRHDEIVTKCLCNKLNFTHILLYLQVHLHVVLFPFCLIFILSHLHLVSFAFCYNPILSFFALGHCLGGETPPAPPPVKIGLNLGPFQFSL